MCHFVEEELAKEIYYLASECDGLGQRMNTVTLSAGVLAVLNHVHSHLGDRLSLTDLDRMAKVSASALSRAFRTELGETPMAYVPRVRVEQARALLASSRYRVQEIATLVGFEDLNTFTKAFKRAFGMPPTGIRGGPKR